MTDSKVKGSFVCRETVASLEYLGSWCVTCGPALFGSQDPTGHDFSVLPVSGFAWDGWAAGP